MAFELDIKKELGDINKLHDEIKTISDRACAIVCVAYLDDFLQKIILSFLCEDSTAQNKTLFAQNGPLSTFSSKIVLAYRLGLISKYEQNSLNLIRKIRNAFAHDLHTDSFEYNPIKELLKNNIPDTEKLPPIDIPLSYSENDKPITPTPERFMKIVFDKYVYETILPKFPKPQFRELDKNSMRSIFTNIVFILHSSFTSRYLQATIERRKNAIDFNDSVSVEKFKVDYLENINSTQLKRLDLLKDKTEFDIEKIDNQLLSPNCEKESLLKIKDKLRDHLSEIQTLINEVSPKTLEYALLLHTYNILKYNKSHT